MEMNNFPFSNLWKKYIKVYSYIVAKYMVWFEVDRKTVGEMEKKIETRSSK